MVFLIDNCLCIKYYYKIKVLKRWLKTSRNKSQFPFLYSQEQIVKINGSDGRMKFELGGQRAIDASVFFFSFSYVCASFYISRK